MTNADMPADAAPKKRSKWPMIVGLFLFLALGGGGFFAVYAGMIPNLSHAAPKDGQAPDLSQVAFVAIAPLTVSVGKAVDNNHLQFTAQLEVNANRAEEVAALSPRILDVINGYLRAVDNTALTDPDALVRLRAQLLRRIQMVTGQGAVRDLLVTQFVMD